MRAWLPIGCCPFPRWATARPPRRGTPDCVRRRRRLRCVSRRPGAVARRASGAGRQARWSSLLTAAGPGSFLGQPLVGFRQRQEPCYDSTTAATPGSIPRTHDARPAWAERQPTFYYGAANLRRPAFHAAHLLLRRIPPGSIPRTPGRGGLSGSRPEAWPGKRHLPRKVLIW